MSTPHPALQKLHTHLNFLPENILQQLLEHLHQTIHYRPVIGIMGKSGTGKSSLCNALFRSSVCATHPLTGCTREAERLTLELGDRQMTIVDLPGIGETPEYDHEYSTLYQRLLPELDLIIWVLRADERAYAADIAMHRFLLAEGAAPSRFLFVLSQADRVSPANEWNSKDIIPSLQQQASLAAISARVAGLFPSSFPVLPVAAPSGWNLPTFVSLMIHALPPHATSAVFSHFRKENCSEQDQQQARENFGKSAGDSFDQIISTFSLPSWMLVLLHRVRQKIIDLLVTLWDKFF
ncbi:MULTISPECIES: GTPase family protein [unclassified Pseudocitrobacter]|uniref:GTPase family protein n=1 Tax=unclassified Pseudocitrobacter TaxID=2638778 RepID=UPI0023E44455|nr:MULTISPECIES: GTPase [unclassified Pseudocitrobacter]MDF3829806.1 50S ribosome-binding GTPase [Pseudocitrobacter sp. 2023EL-00150]MEC5375489.1 50S ribosome-binding GTPase [Pseudocitrobacter sp. MW920760]